MINGFWFLLAILVIVFLKLKNIVSKGQKTVFMILIELGVGFLCFLFLLYAQFATVHASGEQPFYAGNVFEATQWVSFAGIMLPLLMLLTFFEIILALKILAVRNRMLPEES